MRSTRASGETPERKLSPNVSSHAPMSPGSGVGRGMSAMNRISNPPARSRSPYSSSEGKYQGSLA